MKRLTVIAFLALFSHAPALADSFTAAPLRISFRPGIIGDIEFYVPGLAHVMQGAGQILVLGNFTTVDTLSLACANTACTGFNADIELSGLSMKDVIYKSVLYPKVYLNGTLDMTARFISSLPFDLGTLSGDFEACADPTCQTPLFSLTTNLPDVKVFLGVNNNAGNLTLTGFFTVVPEPSSYVLVGTGLVFLFVIRPEQIVSNRFMRR